MKVGIYARISDTKKKNNSDERRQDVFRQIEMGKAFWEGRGIKEDKIEIYMDDGKSAFTEDLNQREGFKRLLNDCRRNHMREIWIEDMTRFSRNLSMGLHWLKELSDLNCNIISSHEGEIEVTSSGGWMKSVIFLMFAEWDSRIKSEKVKIGMQKAKNLGKKIGGFKGNKKKSVKTGSAK